ncbi:hypothetical protein F900_01868 [Acinetobacter modestus]|uniref:Uncharacterized protein n=1 Tax=Acinetobacter modestus TaxID=1776740 RepID=N9LX95_9GAMM|nr:hypothetical protein [Acinetobacter modestus]ENX00884.1 hypothetical protein F900_01868 [Acinetobacter modestus]
MEQQKDFIRPTSANPIMSMSDFFIENPHLKLLRYEPLKNGIRVFYIIIN